jgi:menaquinol-cytochrome c reductase iron-sulfur subunit
VAEQPPKSPRKKSRYTAERGMAGAFEGETVTRRRFMEGIVHGGGGIATAAIALPALGFALGPIFEKTTHTGWQDVGAESEFNVQTYVPRVMNIEPQIGEAGKTTVYIRRFAPGRDDARNKDQPYVAVSTRCAHLGCPVRYVQASERFICPCHGGVYDFQGKVFGGPPVRPLDRFYTRVRSGRVQVGGRFSLNSELERFSPRDPSNHLDGLWQYLYPSRPTT